MSGIWLAMYVVSWVFIVCVCLLLIGGLRQIGLLQLQVTRRVMEPDMTVPSLEKDGPSIGTRLPNLGAMTINGFGPVAFIAPQSRGSTLVMFMTALCESCQHSVEPLNVLVRDSTHDVQVIAIMQADEDACRAFLTVFPLHLPLIADADRTLTSAFAVHRASFGLLYDEHGRLIRKGSIERPDDLPVLLGDVSVPVTGRTHVFPQPA